MIPVKSLTTSFFCFLPDTGPFHTAEDGGDVGVSVPRVKKRGLEEEVEEGGVVPLAHKLEGI